MKRKQEHGALIAPGVIRFERLLPGPIERVWAYLTESELRGRWLASGELEPREGGRMRLHFLHRELSPIGEETPERYRDMEAGHSFDCVVSIFDPPRVLAFAWHEVDGDHSEVHIELSEQGDDVLLTLTHGKLGSERATLLSVASGWHTHLAILADRLAGRAPHPFWSAHERAEAEYRRLIE